MGAPLAVQQTKSGRRVRFTVVVVVVVVVTIVVATAVLVVVVAAAVAVSGGACVATGGATVPSPAGTAPGVCVRARVTGTVGVAVAAAAAADRVVAAAVHDERRTETVQVATVLGVVNVVLEEHLAHLEEGHPGEERIRPGLVLGSNAAQL